MGKRLPKADLLKEISFEKGKLDSQLEKLQAREMIQSGVTPGGWSIKDVLGHLVGWQIMILSFHATEMRGEVPEVPGRGLTWRQTPKLNELIYLDYCEMPLDAVLQEFDRSHREMLQLMENVPDEDFVAVGRFRWAGPSWSLSDYVRAETASHYRWASNHISRWLRKRG